jgi:hypothetical protein
MFSFGKCKFTCILCQKASASYVTLICFALILKINQAWLLVITIYFYGYHSVCTSHDRLISTTNGYPYIYIIQARDVFYISLKLVIYLIIRNVTIHYLIIQRQRSIIQRY